MANLTESSLWEPGIYQWENTDPIEGGPNGIDNVPTRQLANRTRWLRDNVVLASDAAIARTNVGKTWTAGQSTYLGTANGVAAATGVTNDANARWVRQVDGKQLWGPGTVALDTDWFRDAAARLRTTGSITADRFVTAGHARAVGLAGAANSSGNTSYEGGGRSATGNNVQGPVGGDGSAYLYGNSDAVDTSNPGNWGGKAGTFSVGGLGMNLGGGGAGGAFIGGDGGSMVNGTAYPEGGAGIFARGGRSTVLGGAVRAWAGYFAGKSRMAGISGGNNRSGGGRYFGGGRAAGAQPGPAGGDGSSYAASAANAEDNNAGNWGGTVGIWASGGAGLSLGGGGAGAYFEGGAAGPVPNGTLYAEGGAGLYAVGGLNGAGSQRAVGGWFRGGVAAEDGDVEIVTVGRSVVLRSPNGTRFRLAVNDAGALSAIAA